MESNVEPDVALIIPLKVQEDKYLDQCIQSAVSQTTPCSVIVVTHPDTPPGNHKILSSYASNFPHLEILESAPDRAGYAAAINQGWEKTGHERIGILLSDDWLEPDTVQQCLELDSDIVSTGMIYHDVKGNIFLENRLSMDAFEKLEDLAQKAAYMKHFFLFRRTALSKVGGVDESIGLTGADDFDMIWSMLENEASVSFTDRPGYHYRDHDGERLTLRDKDLQKHDYRRILTKHGITGNEQDRIVEQNSIWFGLQTGQVLAALKHTGKYW